MKFVLPLPPAINRMYRTNPNSRGMFKTFVAKQWEEGVRWIFLSEGFMEGIGPREGEIILVLDYYFTNNNNDIDGRLKATLDALEGFLYVNDRQVNDLRVRKFIDKQNPRLELEVL